MRGNHRREIYCYREDLENRRTDDRLGILYPRIRNTRCI